MKYYLYTFLMTLLALPGAGQTFNEVATSSGLTGGYGSPTFFGGGGVSFADFNQDGWDDLTFCTGPGQQLQFYLNNGDSTFTLVDPPYVVHTGESTHAVWVDYDGDGDKDLFVTTYNEPNRLYRNTGGLILVDGTTEAGLPLLNEYSYGASFSDIDLDGDLDLYVCNYGPPWTGEENHLYLNHGDGTFSDITTPLTGNGSQQTWCATFFDYNLDGWPDLYIVNDRHIWPNALLQGGPAGTFTDVSVSSGMDISHLAMNGGVGDYNNDGYPDIYITTNDTSFLMQNQGNGTFVDMANTAGVLFERFGWGGNLFDFDNDLDLDLYVSSALSNFINPNALFVQTAPGVFDEPLKFTGGLASVDTAHSYSNAVGDFDNDGRLDIAVCNGYGYDFDLWHNVNTGTGTWTKVRLNGVYSNPEAIGARLVFWLNDTAYTRSTYVANAYLAQNSETITFGMGANSQVDSLVIYWPYPCGTSGFTKEVIPGADVHSGALNVYTEGCSCDVARTHLVYSTANEGAWTFRQRVENACAGDTIRFVAGLANDTVDLSGPAVQFQEDVIIEGCPGGGPVIRLTEAQSAWTIAVDRTITIAGIEILDGAPSPTYPMVTNAGTLTLDDITITCQGPPGPGQQVISTTGTLLQKGVIEVRQQ